MLNKEENAKEIAEMVRMQLNNYDSEKVDVVLDEETGELNIMYHSGNNSFLIERTNIFASGVNLMALEKMLDELDVGHCW